jgi:hypothetical protein
MKKKTTFWVLIAIVLIPVLTEARITRIVIDRVESPTFEGASFGDIGQYEKIVGRAFGEVDPLDPLNAIIADIALAPRNERGMVEYNTDFYLLKPVDATRGNGLLYYNVVNRGNKGGLNALNFGVVGGNEPTDPGDGFAMKRGYTFLWSGWQPDVLPGGGRMTMRVPIATEAGAEIADTIRTEYIVNAATNTLNLSSGSFTGLTHASYETVSLDNSTATLTIRMGEANPRELVPNDKWAFADCTNVPFPGEPSTTKICLQDGFDPNFIYELLYTAKNPTVLGLGFAATRDLVAFFRHEEQDDEGTLNPLAGAVQTAIMEGSSQSGRYVRTFLDLGFNEDENGRIVFEGMNPHISPGRIPLNVRFGQPGRAYGQHEDHLFPAYESPYTWDPVFDPVAERTAGLLDRCRVKGACPKIIQTVSSTEYWQGRMSLDTTEALGQNDLDIPDNVRIYHFASTQHGPAATPNLGICQQLSNPNPYFEARRALLLVALEHWVLEGIEPPSSQFSTLSEGTLVPSDKESIGWPDIPGVKYTGLLNELTLLDFGPEFNHRDESGIITEPPTVVASRDYAVLVPKVDEDGNEIAGIRSTTLQAPLGTYTGWNLRRAGFAEDEVCGLQGSFIPFRKTQAERMEAGDPRPSLEERYGTHEGYVEAVRAAAEELVTERFLLPEDAERLVQQAEDSDVLR